MSSGRALGRWLGCLLDSPTPALQGAARCSTGDGKPGIICLFRLVFINHSYPCTHTHFFQHFVSFETSSDTFIIMYRRIPCTQIPLKSAAVLFRYYFIMNGIILERLLFPSSCTCYYAERDSSVHSSGRQECRAEACALVFYAQRAAYLISNVL